MHRLNFVRPYLSIDAMPDVELPNFALLTGMNGAGKSHILQAIRNGSIQSDHVPNHGGFNNENIRLFDWNNMVPQDAGYFSGETIIQERIKYYQQLKEILYGNRFANNIREIVINSGLSRDLAVNLQFLNEITEDYLKQQGFLNPKEIIADIKQAFAESDRNILSEIGNEDTKYFLRSASSYAKRPIITLEEKDIVSKAVPSWGRNEIFQQSFARLFVSYRDLFLTNNIRNYRKSKGEQVEGELTDEEFVEMHGPAPWEFVNNILSSAGIGFRINTPDLDSNDQYKPLLTKLSSGKEIEFNALSSGEKILMSFAFCVYYASDRRQVSLFPKLLLLDEIDAPLHPSMSKNMIDTIVKTLVNQYNIKVIATTHSPSTVALTPDEAVHVIRSGEPGIHKISKSEALNILTHGVPTLAVSYEGRRQVFVESPADAKIYDSVYKLIKADIKRERSLDFIATGVRNAEGEERNTGCEVVRRILGSLVDAGNKSVMGLIDWDGSNNPSNRLHVLAHGRKNGLENVILDPLAIGMVTARASLKREKTPILKELGYFEAMNSDQTLLQQIADEVCIAVFGSEVISRVQNQYFGGIFLNIDCRWFEVDDHDLEKQIINAFPDLRLVTRGRPGTLMQYVVDNIFIDNKNFIPMDMRVTFESILDIDAH